MIPQPHRSGADWLGIYLRGLAMGIAEVIPGVSGGTIAFITGIYQELLATLAHVSFASMRVLVDQGIRAFWQEHNLTFVLILGLGMLTSFVLFAKLLSGFIASDPILVWAFFFGLVATSVLLIARHTSLKKLMSGGLLGAVAAGLLSLGIPMQVQPGVLVLFLGGMLAVTAWLLPGVSGSYLLLMMGLYPVVLGAAANMDLTVLGIVAAGCLVGLLLFSKLLAWLLETHRDMLMAVLTGFTAGSLLKLWPWKVAHGDLSLPVLPITYQQALSAEPQLLGALLALLAGTLIVVGLAWHEQRAQL